LRDAVVFDIYKPQAGQSSGLQDHEKSVAVRLTLGRSDATLTEAYIDACVQAVLTHLQARLSVRLRA